MLEMKLLNDQIHTTCKDGQKSWNFPKFSMLSHAFTGICQKGVTTNYNTKPNKHEHKWTQEAYEHSAKKDVGMQVWD